jgi:tricorn protease
MIRRACLTSVLVLFVLSSLAAAAPIRLARYPDYHAGKIAFSYLGDIWVANEDGSNIQRLTDNTAREVYPKFSPDGHWIAFSSNRFGNYDVFVAQATGGTPRRLTYHTGNDEVVGWTRDSQRVVFRSAHGDGAFPTVVTLYQVSVEGGPEQPMPVDWGYWGSYSPDGKQFAFNRHPAVWSRKHYRGSYSADLWVADLAQKTYTKLLPDEKYNRHWPMWGPKDEIYFVADPLPNEKSIKQGSAEVRKSLNNIYKISAKGGAQPVQVTKHTDGNVFFPSMSSDGKVIVYEENFGIWKLDVASGKTSEVRLDITSDEKQNETEVVTVSSELDSFDLSPSGRRAVISTRGQILTIATDRGDITRVAPDNMASRNQSPKWSPDGKYIVFVSDRSGRDEIWLCDPDGKSLKKITDLDNEKAALLWTPDSKSLLYTAGDRKLYHYSVADGKTIVVTSNDVGRIGSVAVSPDSKWVTFSKQDRTMRSHVYIAPITGGEEHHISDDSLLFAENNAVWTGDGRYIVFTSSSAVSGGVASTGGRGGATMQMWALPLRTQDRDTENRDIDNEAQGLAAEATGRGGGGGRGAAAGGAPQQPVEVRIDWDGLARRARRLTVPGDTVGGLTPSPDGRSVAFTSSTAPTGGGPPTEAAGAGAGAPAIYIITVEGQQLTRVPQPAPEPTAAGGRGPGRGGGGFFGGGGGMVFTRDGRTLYFRSGRGLYAASVGGAGGGAPAAAAAAPTGGGGRGGGTAAAAATAAAATGGGTARHVTFTANIEVDHKVLRSQVFNEGWRIMKNRFYDEKMHGADWNAAKATYEPLLNYLVDTEELHNVMMEMIGELNASHTGVSGGPVDAERSTVQTRYPGFDLVSDSSGYFRVGHIYKTGPADHDYLKIHEGDYIISIDDHELKTTDNYWKYLTLAAGRKFHFMLNNKPAKDGAWDVTIEPLNSTAFGNLQYAKWVDDRRAMVDKLSSGEIGYLHIRAMDAASLRQFELDLARNRTKKALIIDQRFNGGGGIDQELLGILAGRAYQYSRGRDSTLDIPRPLNFYGPMVVMQNERSASDAEMFPQGFKDLGLGKVIGVPTMSAVIGTGSYSLLDGSSIRTPGTGIWTVKGENMENYGVTPDVLVDNTPNDFVKGRDAQVEKAVDVLKTELAAAAKRR